MSTLHTLGRVPHPFDAPARTVALVNTGRSSRWAPAADLVDVLVAHGEQLDDRLSPDEVDRCRCVLAELAAVFEADDVDAAAERLNALLARYCAPPRLLCHAGWPWHLHFDRGDDEPWHGWIGASGAFALAGCLAGRSAVPWGVCDAAECERVFVHDDRGARRRHCSPACATRTRVARHRARG
jgi:hypothetical protein